MNFEDLNKEDREELDSIIEDKLMNNLLWSMLFFVFRQLKDTEDESGTKNNLQKEFFVGWKKFAAKNLIKKDLETINLVLNSPRNMFHSLLQNKGETIESTEIYQEKYNKVLKKVEDFYFKSFLNNKNND
jgi:hypothetical protein